MKIPDGQLAFITAHFWGRVSNVTLREQGLTGLHHSDTIAPRTASP